MAIPIPLSTVHYVHQKMYHTRQHACVCVVSVLQGVAESECRRAADAAEAAYMTAFDAAGVIAEEGAMDKEHAVSISIAE